MSINNCQGAAKWSRRAVQIAVGTLVSLGQLLVTVFKLLNDRQSEFRESSEPIMYKLSYIMWTKKFQAIQKKKISLL